MTRIKYAIRTEGTTLFFKVLEQDERLWGRGRLVGGPLAVESYACPNLEFDKVYIRGRRFNCDHYETQLTFPTEADLNAYVAGLHESLAKLADVELTGPEPEPEPDLTGWEVFSVEGK